MSGHARNILVGYDGSGPARRALDIAADLAGYGSTLAVVSVRTEGSQDAAALDDAREHLLRRQISARYLQPVGVPAEALVAAAEELGADLVVVGRRTHGPIPGSVSRAVVRTAPCDVLVVR